jgi:hypothetical protein
MTGFNQKWNAVLTEATLLVSTFHRHVSTALSLTSYRQTDTAQLTAAFLQLSITNMPLKTMREIRQHFLTQTDLTCILLINFLQNLQPTFSSIN